MEPVCVYVLAINTVRYDGKEIYPNACTGIWTPVVQLKSSHFNNSATITYSNTILQK